MSWQEEMVVELKKAQNGEKTRIMRRYEQMTGMTTTHLYRVAKQYGYKTGRKKRCDKGECTLTELQIRFIAGLIHQTRREKKGTIMPVKKALERAEYNDIIEPDSISVARLQELLRERGLNKKALNAAEPHTNMRSLHPNHVHFMDVSVCIQYYLKNGRLRIEREDLFYKNKFQNFAKIKRKIYRYVLTDHFSHTIFVKYYIAKGETLINLFDFLVSAWLPKANDNDFPFKGVPFLLMMDRGAANISGAIIDFLEDMGVEFPEPGQHNPRRQGSVERAQNHVEMYFESMLRVDPSSDINDLNTKALRWCAYMNGSKRHKHGRFGTPRIDCWMKIREDQLRECPPYDICQDIFRCRFEERKVKGDYSISFKGESFRLKHIQGIIPNVSTVKVFKKPFTWPKVVVEFNGTEYIATPIEKADGGFDANAAIIGQTYTAVPESTTQKEFKVIDNLAYGEDRGKDDIPFAGLNGFDFPELNRPEFMPRKSTPMPIENDALAAMAERQVPMFDLFKDLSRVGEMTPKLNRAIRSKYGESIALADRDVLVDALENGLLYVDGSGELQTGGGDDTLKAVVN